VKMRLIDANALLISETFAVSEGACKECENEYRWAIQEAPTVDAVEVVHGEWSTIEDDYLGLTALACSECKQEYWFEEEPPLKIYSYCPNCGAKMDGERKDNDRQREAD